MKNLCIGFIGAGNMASSLINGLLSQGMEPGLILASDIDSSKTEHLRRENGIRIASNQDLHYRFKLLPVGVANQYRRGD